MIYPKGNPIRAALFINFDYRIKWKEARSDKHTPRSKVRDFYTINWKE